MFDANGTTAGDHQGCNGSRGSSAVASQKHPPVPPLWIMGLGSQYPPNLMTPDKKEQLAAKLYNTGDPSMKRLLKINRQTGIQARACVPSFESGFGTEEAPPTIDEIDQLYREAGVNLAVQACQKALREWGGSYKDITHTIGVTCTNSSNPGFDLFVAQKLGLRDDVNRTLLHGVGCAGGLCIMRTAAEIACGATLRRKPARILAFACELCSLSVRQELDAVANAKELSDVSIAAVLFGDGAAAFVLCNEFAMETKQKPLFQVMEWGNAFIPGTTRHIGFDVKPNGFQAILTKEVPFFTKSAITPMYKKLLPSFREKVGEIVDVADFDWALHPGGQQIIDGAKDVMGLEQDQLRATQEVYSTRGNTSSSSVLIVLDKLRQMGPGRDHVVTTSFGPGISIEMLMLRRCRWIEG